MDDTCIILTTNTSSIYFIQQTPDNVPDNHTWLPSDATLHWEVRRKDKEDPCLVYYVKAFQGHHQEFVERVAVVEASSKKQEKKFQGWLSLFSGKTTIERSRVSSADPTTVVNSCGEKFLNKRYGSVYNIKRD